MAHRVPLFSIGLAVLFVTALALAKPECPPPVVEATQHAFPTSKINACNAAQENGKAQYEVKVSTREGRKVELDVTPEGWVMQTEEIVAPTTLPRVVQFGFSNRFPKVKATRAEKHTKANGEVLYELAYLSEDKKPVEATFDAGGNLLEEEKDEAAGATSTK